MAEEKRFAVGQEVRFRDLDAMGHVNNATYFTYFEEVRKAFFHRHYNYAAPADYPFIMAAVSCRFHRPVQLADDPLEVALRVSHVGRKSFVFQYEICRPENPETIFADGESVQVYYDYASDRSVEIPAAFREKLERFLIR
jgi:acyl-CoA thioester hydrolase